MRENFAWLFSCSSNSVCRQILFVFYQLLLIFSETFLAHLLLIFKKCNSFDDTPSKSFSINGWESVNDTAILFNSDKYKTWWPSKHLYKLWPSVQLYYFHKSKGLSKSLPSVIFLGILKAVNTTSNSPSLTRRLSTSEFDPNCNALECSCRSKITVVFVPGGSKSLIFWTSFREQIIPLVKPDQHLERSY